MPIPNPIYLYRIIHIDNLKYILQTGVITSPTSDFADPNYIGIGDASLKLERKIREIPVEPFGTFSDYVAFYFGSRSPMLYEIYHGYNGVTKRNQEEIIYLVSSYEKVEELGLPYIYFDGHGYHKFSQVYNSRAGLEMVDWEAVKSKQWFDTEMDPDKKRRKQAEFLIFNDVPLPAIIGIGVYNKSAEEKTHRLLSEENIDIKTVVIPNWFY